VEDGIRAGRVELYGVETLFDIAQGTFGRHFGIVVDVLRTDILRVHTAGVRIEVGIGPQGLVDLPTEQLVDGFGSLFADDVPAGHFQRRDAALHGDIGTLREA